MWLEFGSAAQAGRRVNQSSQVRADVDVAFKPVGR
jgi:hypothetical protein